MCIGEVGISTVTSSSVTAERPRTDIVNNFSLKASDDMTLLFIMYEIWSVDSQENY